MSFFVFGSKQLAQLAYASAHKHFITSPKLQNVPKLKGCLLHCAINIISESGSTNRTYQFSAHYIIFGSTRRSLTPNITKKPNLRMVIRLLSSEPIFEARTERDARYFARKFTKIVRGYHPLLLHPLQYGPSFSLVSKPKN